MTTHAAALTLEDVDLRVTKGRAVPLKGVLRARPTIEEVAFLAASPAGVGTSGSPACRAFRVHGSGLSRDGLLDGDYLILREAPSYRPGTVVLVEGGTAPVLRKVQQRADGRRCLVPISGTLPFGEPVTNQRILGAFAGVLRRRGFARTAVRESSTVTGERRFQGPATSVPSHSGLRPRKRADRPQAILRSLQERLGSLESTYASTDNPRLRVALKNEADRLRLLLQNGADAARTR